MTDAEPRAHHFVPQCWLAGFTGNGQRLWVTDYRKRKQWPSTPVKSGHRRDFYRVSAPELDPLVVERTFSGIEAHIAPILKSLDEHLREPTLEELNELLGFIAIQAGRVPAFRLLTIALVNSTLRAKFCEALKCPESWAAALRDAGVTLDDAGPEYENVKRFLLSGDYGLSARAEWHILQALIAAETIFPCLSDRHWHTLISKTGSFIGSDNPVTLDGPKNQKVGFENAEVVLYPVSRHVLFFGTKIPGRPPTVTLKNIAAFNTATMLSADSQVYSHVHNFCFLDEKRQYRTDWTLFSKDKYM